MQSAATDPEVTVIIVSYNTRVMTLRAIETLLENAGKVAMEVVIWDNASHDGSADAIAAAYPELKLIRSDENVGFAKANNVIAESATTEWLLLLNPDTETHPAAVENLLRFGKQHPEAGIYGGRTVFPDGSLNIASCWNTLSVWSLFCSAFGLSAMFRDSAFFNPEGIGGWKRDSVRHVDVVVGCFLLISTSLWHELAGFSPRYFMYGEEHDLCLRAAKIGYKPMITPDAQIMHLVGASSARRQDKLVRLMRSKATLIRDHWSKPRAAVGIALLWLWGANRRLASIARPQSAKASGGEDFWRSIWSQRHIWLGGY